MLFFVLEGDHPVILRYSSLYLLVLLDVKPFFILFLFNLYVFLNIGQYRCKHEFLNTLSVRFYVDLVSLTFRFITFSL